MKRLISVLFVLTLLVLISVNAFAYNAPSAIRVGLISRYSEASSIPLTDRAISVGGEYSGEFNLFGNDMKLVIPDTYYVYLERSYSQFDEAERFCSELEAKGYDSAPIYYGKGDFGVCVVVISSENARAFANELGGEVHTASDKQIAIKNGNDTILLTENTIKISAQSGYATALGGRSYRGEIEFGRYKGKGITPVNVLSPDEYLFGVVGSEMPSSWSIEALKAQAVAARTYAIYNSKKHTANGYGICDTTDCQAYGGVDKEVESVVNAVRATAGEIMCYNGEPIQAVFSASSGGYTCNSEDAWVTFIPYLRAVDDSHEASRVWTRTYSASEIEGFLSAKGVNIGSVKNVAVTKVGPGGRCLELTFVGTKGTKTYTKESVRTFFNVSRDGSFPSTVFTINGNSVSEGSSDSMYIQNSGRKAVSDLTGMYVMTGGGLDIVDSSSVTAMGSGGITHTYEVGEVLPISTDYLNQTATTFVFSGKGNGHGVGMSQYGAKALAEKGYTYDEILKYYYIGSEIE